MKLSAFQLTAMICLGVSSATIAPAETILLRGATVHTVSGEIFSPGDVLIQDGKIAAVGKNLTVQDATIVDLEECLS